MHPMISCYLLRGHGLVEWKNDGEVKSVINYVILLNLFSRQTGVKIAYINAAGVHRHRGLH